MNTDVCTHKSVLEFANDKLWFSKQVREVINLKEEAHKEGDTDSYSQAMTDEGLQICKAGVFFLAKIETALYSRDYMEVWRTLSNLISKGLQNSITSLPNLTDELKYRFNKSDNTTFILDAHL